jgi:hypothetical protein
MDARVMPYHTHIAQGDAPMTAWTSSESATIEKARGLEHPSLRADEPSHIHIPRPSRAARSAAEIAPLEPSNFHRQGLTAASATP